MSQVFRKCYDHDFEMESEKAMALYEASRSSTFLSPRPKHINADKRTIDYEMIPDLRPIRDFYLKYLLGKSVDESIVQLFYGGGVALAELHDRLTLHRRTHWKPAESFSEGMEKARKINHEEFLDSTPMAFLHGDYGFSNLCYIRDGKRHTIVIIDASPDNYSVFDCTAYGSVYLDIAHFISCLDGLIPIKYYPFANWKRIGALKEAFISGYEATSGNTIDTEWINALAYASVVSKFSQSRRQRLIRPLLLKVVYNSLKGNTLL